MTPNPEFTQWLNGLAIKHVSDSYSDIPLDDLTEAEFVERDTFWRKAAEMCVGYLYYDISVGHMNKGRLAYYKKFGRPLPFEKQAPGKNFR